MIVRYAREQSIDLIVMGTHGRTGLALLALGSVADKVLRSSPCPVLVVRPDRDPKVETVENDLFEVVDGSPALGLIQRPILLRATDIHIDPISVGEISVRIRIDGNLDPYCKLDAEVGEHLAQQLKVLADLDFADSFRPKEGRLQLPPSMSDWEVRITSSPVAGGEAAALRVFSRENVCLPLDQLGFSETSLAAVERMLRQGEGIVLVTGPTGAGKSTTVYSMLETLGSAQRNIVSIEDPVECDVAFVRQMNVDERHEISMTSGLRTLLRMDPDIVFVGEIRDVEAADMAMRAASSGRHVFSTLHTRKVASTVTALRDLHIDNCSLAGNLTGIISQRLVRRLCPQCKLGRPPTDEQRSFFSQHEVEVPAEVFEAPGYDFCRGTGYHGRVGVFETAAADDRLCDSIAQGASEDELRKIIRSAGVQSVSFDVLSKMGNSVTSFDEAMSVHWM